ncbi:TIGR00725 family protein [bacterium]|nr:TIGR00725 family protein [bacterium]
MKLRKKIKVGIIGGARPQPKFKDIAYQVGRMIAEKGAILVCGGLSGIMEAAAKGAREHNGLTVGILPGYSPHDANPHIEIPIATGLGYSRNSLVAMNSDILVAVDGEYGTLSEIAYGCIYGKKIIGIGTWNIPGVKEAQTAQEAMDLVWKEFFPLR